MLQFLRKKAQSLVIQIIVVIIALVFIFWGVGTNLMNRQEAAILVNGEEISFQDYQQAYEQAYARIAQQFGGTIPKGLAEGLNIKQQIINQLVQAALLRQGGMDMGLTVSGNEIQKEIEGMTQFQNNGSFDIERYKAILASNRLSPEKYEDSLRYDLMANKTMANISAFALEPTDFEIEDLYNLEKEAVFVSYTVVSPKTYLDEVEVEQAGLEQWFQENGTRYQTEKMVQLTYLPFIYKQVGEKVTIEAADIQGYYDQHLTEYQTPEKRHARHILFKATDGDPEDEHLKQQAMAEEIRARAENGEDFASLAREFSEGPSGPTGGDLGFFERGRMVKPFDDVVFSMETGTISEVVKTDFGYHVISLEEIQLAGIRPLEDVQAEIEDKLKLEQAKPLAFQLANSAYENIISAGSLAAFRDAYPETGAITTEFLARSAPPAGITSDPVFLDKAFSLKEGELSSLIETGEGYAIISATAIREPQVPELAEVREKAEQDYKTVLSEEKAKAVAEELITTLAAETAGFATIAESEGFPVQESGPLLKASADPASPFPPNLVNSAFKLSASAPVAEEPGLVIRDYFVYWFDKRTPPQAAMRDEDRTRYREILQQMKEQQLLDGWLKNQQSKADITIHSSLDNF
jgi:peptidyl-prolyl cis-trans isomerase D